MTEPVIIAIITAVCSGGLGAAVVAWLKDRKKDNATAKLTDVEALQKQVVLLTTVTDFLRKENDQLQKDYEHSETQRRDQRLRLEELESKLGKVQRECSDMREQIQRMKGDAA